MMMSASRSVHASTVERSLLLSVMASHLRVLDTRDHHRRSDYTKANLWDQVTRQFNERSLVHRSRHQIQTLYKNMKAKAKKYQMRIVEAQTEGLPLPEQDDVSEMLIKMLDGEKKQQISETDYLLNCIDYKRDPKEEFFENNSDSPNQIDHLQLLEVDLQEDEESLPNDFKSSLKHNRSSGFNSDNEAESNSPKKLKKSLYSDDDDSTVTSNLQSISYGFSENVENSNLSIKDNNLDNYRESRKSMNEEASSDGCCCPTFHNEIVTMLQREHKLRMTLLQEERESKIQEHKTRMKIMELEYKLLIDRNIKDTTLTNVGSVQEREANGEMKISHLSTGLNFWHRTKNS